MRLSYIWSKILKKMRGSSVRNCNIDGTSKIESGSNLVNTKMDKHSFCGYNCEISNTEIGSFCSIANGVIIGGGTHPMEWVSTSPVFYVGRDSVKMKFSEYERGLVETTIVGNDVWIGQNVLIKQGVTIGNGAVVGMGSVVTRDIPAYAIFAGNPARFIRSRFDEETVSLLEASRWWEMDEVHLRECAKEIKNPIEFIRNMGDLNDK